MKNKNLKIIGIVFLITTLVAIALTIVEGINQLNYIKELKSDKTKALLEAISTDYSKLSATWTVYVGFALSPISLLIIGYFNFVIWKSDKDGRTIVKWPMIVVLVFAVITALSPLLTLLSKDSEYLLSKVSEMKDDNKWDAVKAIVKPLYDANVKPALSWVGFAISICEGLIAVPAIMQIKKAA